AANEALALETESLEAFLQANVAWHVAVAHASHNELLMGFMTALSSAIYDSTDNKGFVNEEVRSTAVNAHQRINEAIRDRDPDAAVRRMERHVHGYAEAVLAVEDRESIEVRD